MKHNKTITQESTQETNANRAKQTQTQTLQIHKLGYMENLQNRHKQEQQQKTKTKRHRTITQLQIRAQNKIQINTHRYTHT